eukprot:TRINITY_DN15145_c0_g1_i6.p1 TRINITY_DN15145_c0_g1~~TRINITY_DN15145_c0_g1_i6.p1  ORF type:complete len:452 (+),score=82.48 TRINITY_DN15145_c0_g1_i6:147-1502(+)
MECLGKCKEHGMAILMYCKDCRLLVCVKCLYAHEKKGCKHPVTLFSYAEQDLLPKLTAQLEEVEGENQELEESIKNFISSSKRVRKSLLTLKGKTEKLLANISKSIELFNASETLLFPTVGSIKKRIETECEELVRAVKREDAGHIAEKINSKGCGMGIDDSEKHLVEALNGSMSEFIKSQELEVLNELLEEFNQRYQRFSDKKNKEFVYGIHHPQTNCGVLCKFDITSKVLHTSVAVPQYSALLQLGQRVFISGGYKPCVNTLSEFIEDSQSLTKRESMKYAKCYHAVQTTSRKSFVTIGGWNISEISCCEKYSLVTNSWELLPPLKKPRFGSGAAVISERYLYAVGGYPANNIEMLDTHENKHWNIINIKLSEVKLQGNVIAFGSSSAEIMVFNGEGSAGVLNVVCGTIRKCLVEVKMEGDCGRSVCVMGRKVLIMEGSGRVVVFDMNS